MAKMDSLLSMYYYIVRRSKNLQLQSIDSYWAISEAKNTAFWALSETDKWIQ